MEEFGTVLRAWRDRVQPRQLGLPQGANRRTRGLRREELALAAGVSVDYLVRMEQGRATNPSPQLLGALARALQLSVDERDHLYRLAGAPVPNPATVPTHIGPGVQRIVQRLGSLPVAIFSAAQDLLWASPLWDALFADPSAETGMRINLLWRVFVDEDVGVSHDGGEEKFRAGLVADLREVTGRYPDDPRLRLLVDRLLESSESFATLWAHTEVAKQHSSQKIVHTDTVGDVIIDCDILSAPDSGDLRIVVYTVEPGSEAERKLDLLRVVGSQSPSRDPAAYSAGPSASTR
ncbi:helix-turn-helix domain-containing protein [Microbacterium sp. NPDC056234]|uniref:helix-turn-helix domain-containing protein n=1 Tax=Microbacterium sp. NPDC056234 TaxID=3345757 RepID=UPI0035E1285B